MSAASTTHDMHGRPATGARVVSWQAHGWTYTVDLDAVLARAAAAVARARTPEARAFARLALATWQAYAERYAAGDRTWLPVSWRGA